jgi:hypothetical protein
LFDADFAGESTIGLVEDILGGYFDSRAEVLASEEEVECRGGNDDFCVGKTKLACLGLSLKAFQAL